MRHALNLASCLGMFGWRRCGGHNDVLLLGVDPNGHMLMMMGMMLHDYIIAWSGICSPVRRRNSLLLLVAAQMIAVLLLMLLLLLSWVHINHHSGCSSWSRLLVFEGSYFVLKLQYLILVVLICLLDVILILLLLLQSVTNFLNMLVTALVL